MSTSRVIVTLDELSAQLTSQLQEVEGAAGSKIAVQYILQEPDANGCNWSDRIVLTVGPKSASEKLLPFVAQVVQAAQMRFNVKE
jgi:hypothetical protein